MFTGLVEDVGTVVALKRSAGGKRLSVRTSLEDLSIGESIAVSGVCQTVIEFRSGVFSCDVMAETLRVTSLGNLKPRAPVNLERALTPGDRIGGHFVNGHIDGLGTIRKITRREPFQITISVNDDISRYIVSRGSVAVDGVSLTVGPAPSRGSFTVYIIPHTWRCTNLGRMNPGDRVNIEVDIIGKYVERFAGKVLRTGSDVS